MKKNPLERFLSKVDKSTDNGCWLWTGAVFNHGYPRFKLFEGGKEKTVKGNRQAWRFFRNEEPGDMHVLHTCDNKLCVNPDHLYLGTHQQNMRDSKERGRHASGVRSGKFKMHPGLLERIRDLRICGVHDRDIAAHLNIGFSTIDGWARAGFL